VCGDIWLGSLNWVFVIFLFFGLCFVVYVVGLFCLLIGNDFWIV
jgi:hypothetical protein